jgi:hypothetical protein
LGFLKTDKNGLNFNAFAPCNAPAWAAKLLS